MKPQHLGALALWFPLILGGIGAMHWGAERVSNLLGGLRRHWGLPETAAGTVLALATSSPELAVNTVSAIFRWPDIGLGTDLGANVPALPVILSISWVAARWFGRQRRQDQESPPPIGGETVPVQFSPYLLVVLLLAALTLPPAWRGLRPIDAAILAAAFAIYFAHAVLRGRGQSESKRNNDGDAKTKHPVALAFVGVGAIALGGLGSVFGSRHVNDALGVPDLIGGLFINGLLCAMPETFAAWSLGRRGQVTTALSSAVADGISSMTLAFVPLALVRAPVGQLGLYSVTLGCLGLQLTAFLLLIRRRPPTGDAPFESARLVLPIAVIYAVYLAIVFGVLL